MGLIPLTVRAMANLGSAISSAYLIRQHNLDSNLVKAYAADFCGTEALSGASRELVESFISHLATAAKENRDALVCKLNSYAQPVEAQP